MNQELTLGVLVFNQGKFVDALLKSIARQIQTDTPILIIDNGSSDNSVEKLKLGFEKYGLLDRVTFLQNQSNTGSAAGLLQLLENSQTPFLAVIHGDDMLEETYTDNVLKYIAISKNFAALNVTLKTLTSSNFPKSEENFYKPLWTRSKLINRLLVCGLNPGVMPGSILNRDFILSRRLLHFTEKVNGVEDTLLWMRIIRSGGEILTIKKPCYWYRIHESQFSFQDSRNSFYFGFARKFVIRESRNRLESLLSRSEIAYEIKRFGFNSRYLEGLGDQCLKFSWFFSLFRIFNILLRRATQLFLRLDQR